MNHIVTDRTVLDKQIRDTIRQFAQVGAIVGHADDAADLRRYLESGKKIIITTVQKFPFVVEQIGSDHRGRRFAIIIDEAHSSQGGAAAATMNRALAPDGAEAEDETAEDAINRLISSRRMLPNASYFAFTATPKNRTLEVFGEALPGPNATRHRPFHSYTMKQAIEEGFILDVLAHYTPVSSYYQLIKSVADDPEFDTRQAQKQLRRYVESNQHAIRAKAAIMVAHFHEQVLAKQKIGGQARAMVVCNGVERAIEYFYAIRACLAARKSPYQAIVAFAGEREHGGVSVSEGSLNGFASNLIPERFREEPYRFLVCADKFQTGYDEPLLHTMYVDKTLSDIKAVQTLSRLNRAHQQKHDTFVLDFQNDAETIRAAFEPYYRTTLLSAETDPNRLHDLHDALARADVYDAATVEQFVALYLAGVPRDRLDPLLDASVEAYVETLDEEGQVAFKGNARAFVRSYGFLAALLPFSNPGWEKLSILLTYLIPRLPAPREDDPASGLLDAIDMDSYRSEVKASIAIVLADDDGAIDPPPVSGTGKPPEPELDHLSNIVRSFNEQFADIGWTDADRVQRFIKDVPALVAEDRAYQNAMQHSDAQNARIEHDSALGKVFVAMLATQSEVFKQFHDNASFEQWLSEMSFAATYRPPTEQ